jgi:hypothetical protein
MPLIAGQQVVGACGIGALQKFVVAGVLGNPERPRRSDDVRMVSYELEVLLPEAAADLQLRASEHFTVLRENRVGNVKPGRFRNGQQKDGAGVRPVSALPRRGCW